MISQRPDDGQKIDQKKLLNYRDFSSFEDVFRRLFLLHLPLEQDLQRQPAEEEDKLGQGDQ